MFRALGEVRGRSQETVGQERNRQVPFTVIRGNANGPSLRKSKGWPRFPQRADRAGDR